MDRTNAIRTKRKRRQEERNKGTRVYFLNCLLRINSLIKTLLRSVLLLQTATPTENPSFSVTSSEFVAILLFYFNSALVLYSKRSAVNNASETH